MWIYVDVWSRVMLLQFPSGRFFPSFFIIFLVFCAPPPRSSPREEENCVFFGHSLDGSSSCIQSFRPFAFTPSSECVFFFAAAVAAVVCWTRRKKNCVAA
jgi:hypothetical protein